MNFIVFNLKKALKNMNLLFLQSKKAQKHEISSLQAKEAQQT